MALIRYHFGFNLMDPHHTGTTGNGTWHVEASSLEEAMRAVLPGILFPGEMAGRVNNVMVPGQSIEGIPGHEVIQVWSNDPDVVKKTQKLIRDLDVVYQPKKRIGDILLPDTYGLEVEIRVRDLPDLIAKWNHKLALPGPSGESLAISPMGAELSHAFAPQQRQIQAFNHLRPKLELLILRDDLARRERGLSSQAAIIRQQSVIHQAYHAGGSQRRVVSSGDRAPAGDPYWIFPERLYLSEEIGLVMNLVDMDCRDMDEVYQWLGRDSHWKRLLPLPKCILVTRVRARARDYKDPWLNIIHNELNMQHLVWVRDGDYCVALGCDLHLDDPILPDAGSYDTLVRELQEKIWESRFQPRGEVPKPGLNREWMGYDTVYHPVTDLGLRKYPSMGAWLQSPDYSQEVQDVIKAKAQEITLSHMRGQAPILAYLQGIVDRGGLLNIPQGINLLGEESAHYLRLGNAYSALADPRGAQTMEKILSPRNLVAGDWVVAKKLAYGDWSLVQVKAVEADGFTVAWRLRRKNYPHGYAKNPTRVKLPFARGEWMPWDKMAPDMVRLLLDDRSWKNEHRELVPLLARWEQVQSSTAKVNDTVLDLRG